MSSTWPPGCQLVGPLVHGLAGPATAGAPAAGGAGARICGARGRRQLRQACRRCSPCPLCLALLQAACQPRPASCRRPSQAATTSSSSQGTTACRMGAWRVWRPGGAPVAVPGSLCCSRGRTVLSGLSGGLGCLQAVPGGLRPGRHHGASLSSLPGCLHMAPAAAQAGTARESACAVHARGVAVVHSSLGVQVGDDAASAAFKAWWEAEAVPHGARLCYNTGRALVSPAAVRPPGLAGAQVSECACLPAGVLPAAAARQGRGPGRARRAHRRSRHAGVPEVLRQRCMHMRPSSAACCLTRLALQVAHRAGRLAQG